MSKRFGKARVENCTCDARFTCGACLDAAYFGAPKLPPVKARCHKNGGTCGYFTDGKVYDVRTPYISRRIGEVTDDLGHSRCIPLDGGVCTHIVIGYGDRYRGHECVGTWEVLS